MSYFFMNNTSQSSERGVLLIFKMLNIENFNKHEYFPESPKHTHFLQSCKLNFTFEYKKVCMFWGIFRTVFIFCNKLTKLGGCNS